MCNSNVQHKHGDTEHSQFYRTVSNQFHRRQINQCLTIITLCGIDFHDFKL